MKKRDQNLNLAREHRKLQNIRVMIKPIVIGRDKTVPKYFEKKDRKNKESAEESRPFGQQTLRHQ